MALRKVGPFRKGRPQAGAVVCIESVELSKEAAWICRYPSSDQGYQDIVLQPDGLWEIRRYSQNQRLLRAIAPMAKENLHAGGQPSRVVLKAYGLGGYELRVSLIEAALLEKLKIVTPDPQSD